MRLFQCFPVLRFPVPRWAGSLGAAVVAAIGLAAAPARADTPDQLWFTATTMDGREVSGSSYAGKHGIGFPQINDASGEIWSRSGFAWQPAFAFVSSNGDVGMVKSGDLLSEDQLNERVASLR